MADIFVQAPTLITEDTNYSRSEHSSTEHSSTERSSAECSLDPSDLQSSFVESGQTLPEVLSILDYAVPCDGLNTDTVLSYLMPESMSTNELILDDYANSTDSLEKQNGGPATEDFNENCDNYGLEDLQNLPEVLVEDWDAGADHLVLGGEPSNSILVDSDHQFTSDGDATQSDGEYLSNENLDSDSESASNLNRDNTETANRSHPNIRRRNATKKSARPSLKPASNQSRRLSTSSVPTAAQGGAIFLQHLRSRERKQKSFDVSMLGRDSEELAYLRSRARSPSPAARAVSTIIDYSDYVIEEILITERQYVQDLDDLVNGYIACTQSYPSVPQELIDRIFGNTPEILEFHRQFLEELEHCGEDPISIARLFVKYSQNFSIYAKYCTNYPNSFSALSKLLLDPRLADAFRKQQLLLGHGLPIGSYLHKPVQRVLKYHLLLQSLLRHYTISMTKSLDELNSQSDLTDGSTSSLNVDTSQSDARDIISSALQCMTDCAHHINEMKRSHEEQMKLQDIQSRLYDLQGGFDLLQLGSLAKEGELKLYGAKSERKVYLFEKAIIICKRRDDGDLTCKTAIMCNNLMIIESIPREPLSFHVVPFDNPKLQHTLQARTLESKRDWCSLIKKYMLESYNVPIPDQAKERLLALTGKSDKDEKFASRQFKSHALRPHQAPDYIERKRRKSQPFHTTASSETLPRSKKRVRETSADARMIPLIFLPPSAPIYRKKYNNSNTKTNTNLKQKEAVMPISCQTSSDVTSISHCAANGNISTSFDANSNSFSSSSLANGLVSSSTINGSHPVENGAPPTSQPLKDKFDFDISEDDDARELLSALNSTSIKFSTPSNRDGRSVSCPVTPISCLATPTFLHTASCPTTPLKESIISPAHRLTPSIFSSASKHESIEEEPLILEDPPVFQAITNSLNVNKAESSGHPAKKNTKMHLPKSLAVHPSTRSLLSPSPNQMTRRYSCTNVTQSDTTLLLLQESSMKSHDETSQRANQLRELIQSRGGLKDPTWNGEIVQKLKSILPKEPHPVKRADSYVAAVYRSGPDTVTNGVANGTDNINEPTTERTDTADEDAMTMENQNSTEIEQRRKCRTLSSSEEGGTSRLRHKSTSDPIISEGEDNSAPTSHDGTMRRKTETSAIRNTLSQLSQRISLVKSRLFKESNSISPEDESANECTPYTESPNRSSDYKGSYSSENEDDEVLNIRMNGMLSESRDSLSQTHISRSAINLRAAKNDSLDSQAAKMKRNSHIDLNDRFNLLALSNDPTMSKPKDLWIKLNSNKLQNSMEEAIEELPNPSDGNTRILQDQGLGSKTNKDPFLNESGDQNQEIALIDEVMAEVNSVPNTKRTDMPTKPEHSSKAPCVAIDDVSASNLASSLQTLSHCYEVTNKLSAANEKIPEINIPLANLIEGLNPQLNEPHKLISAANQKPQIFRGNSPDVLSSVPIENGSENSTQINQKTSETSPTQTKHEETPPTQIKQGEPATLETPSTQTKQKEPTTLKEKLMNTMAGLDTVLNGLDQYSKEQNDTNNNTDGQLRKPSLDFWIALEKYIKYGSISPDHSSKHRAVRVHSQPAIRHDVFNTAEEPRATNLGSQVGSRTESKSDQHSTSPRRTDESEDDLEAPTLLGDDASSGRQGRVYKMARKYSTRIKSSKSGGRAAKLDQFRKQRYHSSEMFPLPPTPTSPPPVSTSRHLVKIRRTASARLRKFTAILDSDEECVDSPEDMMTRHYVSHISEIPADKMLDSNPNFTNSSMWDSGIHADEAFEDIYERTTLEALESFTSTNHTDSNPDLAANQNPANEHSELTNQNEEVEPKPEELRDSAIYSGEDENSSLNNTLTRGKVRRCASLPATHRDSDHQDNETELAAVKLKKVQRNHSTLSNRLFNIRNKLTNLTSATFKPDSKLKATSSSSSQWSNALNKRKPGALVNERSSQLRLEMMKRSTSQERIVIGEGLVRQAKFSLNVN